MRLGVAGQTLTMSIPLFRATPILVLCAPKSIPTTDIVGGEYVRGYIGGKEWRGGRMRRGSQRRREVWRGEFARHSTIMIGGD